MTDFEIDRLTRGLNKEKNVSCLCLQREFAAGGGLIWAILARNRSLICPTQTECIHALTAARHPRDRFEYTRMAADSLAKDDVSELRSTLIQWKAT